MRQCEPLEACPSLLPVCRTAESVHRLPPPHTHISVIMAGETTKTRLVDSLKSTLRNLTMRCAGMAREGGLTPQPIPSVLSEEVREVREVLQAAEQCVFHGLRVEDFHGVFPFWALLERLEGPHPRLMADRPRAPEYQRKERRTCQPNNLPSQTYPLPTSHTQPTHTPHTPTRY